MASLIQNITITAAPDGLVLLPSSPSTSFSASSLSNPSPPEARSGLKLDWRSARPSTVSPDPAQQPPPAPGRPRVQLSAHGVLGVLTLAHTSYVVAITAREPVATIRHCSVFRVQAVALVPLSGRAEAERVLAAAGSATAAGGGAGHEDAALADESDNGEEEAAEENASVGSVESAASLDDDSDRRSARGKGDGSVQVQRRKGRAKEGDGGGGGGVVRDVIQQRGKYGRFAERWLSRGGGGSEGVRRSQGMSRGDEKAEGRAARDGGGATATPATLAAEDTRSAIEALTPKILRNARLYFSSSGFYFSYDYDLTRSSAQLCDSGRQNVPLWKQADPLFFWNRHLLEPLTGAGCNSFALPVIQGFVGQRDFSIARTEGDENDMIVSTKQKSRSSLEKQAESIPLGDWNKKHSSETSDFVLTLVSRRSVKRAGLRYLRRGIDDEGNVANSVETEQILSARSWSPQEKSFSLTQIRGSMPLFFKQSPYSFKPVPEMFGSEAANQEAFKQHFTRVLDRYSAVHAVSLVDKHGTEKTIGEAYEHRVKQSNKQGQLEGRAIDYEWFDFHGVCKGMKFENISLLLDALGPSIKSFSWAEQQDGKTTHRQSGVFRTNCMDCLDRTNVVQSAIAGNVLQQQLASLALQIDLQSDPRTQWFNTLWADNGDAISRQYAGTAALKGDFTRTRKRNWTGALSDFSLTLNRYYNNIFSDYFLQTCIDYYLGNAGTSLFDDFETNMMSKDYALNMQHVRAHAIETCEKMALGEPHESLVGAWTLSCPHEANTLRTLPFEECVLMLSKAAIYFCRIDWATEKLESFERVELKDVTEMHKGPYVTNALGKLHLDESRNVGFVLRFKAPEGGVLRKNTRSLLNEEEFVDEGSAFDAAKKAITGEADIRFLAFKALPLRDTASKEEDWESADMSEMDIVTHICEEIRHAIVTSSTEGSNAASAAPKILEKSIVSASEARKSTGYAESIGYSLKKLVWS